MLSPKTAYNPKCGVINYINSDAVKFKVGAPVFVARIGCTVSSKSTFDAEKVSENSQHALRACNFCPEMSVYRISIEKYRIFY